MNKKQKKIILVTGAAGFIGSNLANELLRLNYQVVGLDNFLDNYEVSIKKNNIRRLLSFKHFTFYETNILDVTDLEKIFSTYRFDIIIHLAARAGIRPSLVLPQAYFETNVIGTINILELMRKKSIKQLIFASSSSVYGNNKKTPFSETDNTDHPVSPYGASKKSAEIICQTYAHLYQIQTTVFRFFSVYGNAGRPDMAPYIFSQAILHKKPIRVFGKSITRDYTHIDDIVRGIISGIEHPTQFEIINLGNNSPIGLEQLIGSLEKILHKKSDVIHEGRVSGDVNTTYADIRKAKKLLDWEPLVSLEKGLKQFTKWLQMNGPTHDSS
ncbi:MAG: GDP-mannose 4,6-dehydratase [Patescibacteria group bacterium]